jgi:hypothetical protein
MSKIGVGGNAYLGHEISRSQEEHVHFLLYSHGAEITQLEASLEHPRRTRYPQYLTMTTMPEDLKKH